MPKGHGPNQKKILLLLLGGLTLGLSGSPKQYFKVLKAIGEEWKEIDREALRRSIRPLYRSKLVTTKTNRDGTQTLVLSEKGKQWALTYQVENMVIPAPARWDEKWRVVIFDIPERRRKVRNLLRVNLQSLGFRELQKSVFVHPYPCIDQIEYIVEHYNIGRYVRFILAESIDNERYLKKKFKIS